MTIEILVNIAPRETRAAIIENDVLQEIYVERTSRRGLVSNVYKGRVSRVLPGMQAAFVDIGLERTAFLHAADIANVPPHDATVVLPAPLSPAEDIRRLVNPGDDILVQVIKDPIGTKGARLTTFVALPSRYLVYMPRGEGIGVSARIDDEGERQRLKAAVASLITAEAPGGYILRTAAQGVTVESLRPIKGAIRWHKEGLSGIVFHQPLTFDELAEWLSKRIEVASLRASTQPVARS